MPWELRAEAEAAALGPQARMRYVLLPGHECNIGRKDCQVLSPRDLPRGSWDRPPPTRTMRSRQPNTARRGDICWSLSPPRLSAWLGHCPRSLRAAEGFEIPHATPLARASP